jgi:positive regulator of sigma E activity
MDGPTKAIMQQRLFATELTCLILAILVGVGAYYLIRWIRGRDRN